MIGWLVAREKCISTFKWRPSGAVFPTAAAVAFYRPSTDSIQLPPRDPPSSQAARFSGSSSARPAQRTKGRLVGIF